MTNTGHRLNGLQWCVYKSYNATSDKTKLSKNSYEVFPYPALKLFPEDDLSNWWWLGATELGIPELNMMFDACGDGWVWIAESGRRGPNESICGRWCMNGIWGIWGWPCPCMLLAYAAGMLVWGMEPGTPTGLGLMLAGLDGMVLLLPGIPVEPNRADLIRARSAEIRCLTLSTCSHSFKSKVSTSANCFNFNSNLFNWWFITVAASLWTSRSSWSAKSLDFIAAADRPYTAACFTFSGETAGDGPV